MESKLTEMEEKILRILERALGSCDMSYLSMKLVDYPGETARAEEMARALNKLLRKSFIEIKFVLRYSRESRITVIVRTTCEGMEALQDHQNQERKNDSLLNKT